MRRPGPHFGDHPRVRSGVFYFLTLLLLLQLASWGFPRLLGWHQQQHLVIPDTLQQGILEAMRRPAEKTKAWHEYRGIFIRPERVQAGVAFWEQHADSIARVSAETGESWREQNVAVLGADAIVTVPGGYRLGMP